MLHSPIIRFFWQVVIWLPLCFAAWYYMAILMTMPVVWLSGLVISLLQPEVIEGVAQHGHHLEIFTLLEPRDQSNASAPTGQVAQLTLSINVLKYSYGIPLFTALMLSSPENEEKWARWGVGVSILYLAQTWGVYFEVLATLYFQLGAEISRQLAPGKVYRELVALGYQLGYLILPAVTPLILWLIFNREFLEKLVPGLTDRSPDISR